MAKRILTKREARTARLPGTGLSAWGLCHRTCMAARRASARRSRIVCCGQGPYRLKMLDRLRREQDCAEMPDAPSPRCLRRERKRLRRSSLPHVIARRKELAAALKEARLTRLAKIIARA